MFLSLSLVSCLLSLALCAYVYLHDLIIDFALNVIPLPPRRSLSSLLPPLFPLSFPFPQLSRPPSALPFWGSMAMTPPPLFDSSCPCDVCLDCCFPVFLIPSGDLDPRVSLRRDLRGGGTSKVVRPLR